MKMKKMDVGIITPPISKAGFVPLLNLISIVQSFSSVTRVITSFEKSDLNKVDASRYNIVDMSYKYHSSVLMRIVNNLIMQWKISFYMIKSTDIQIWIFFLDAHTFLLPVITSKLLRKQTIVALAASLFKTSDTHKHLIDNGAILTEAISFKMADRIVIYSSLLIKNWKLEKYRKKIFIAHEHYVDFNHFKLQNIRKYQRNEVGYVGRLSAEKGVLNLAEAALEILKTRNDFNLLIGGEGDLRGNLERYIDKNNLHSHVKLCGWIDHDKLPGFLNDIGLLIIPSYTEGLPNIMLEAMACGTPVLTTAVGAIPDYIKNGETGFILEDNSPECIARNVMNALNHPNIEQIAENGRKLIEKEFTFEKTMERYQEILKEF